jgi:hypothetical protein
MSEQNSSSRPALLSISNNISAVFKCCSSNSSTENTTVIADNDQNSLRGNDAAQTISPVVKTTSSLSADLAVEVAPVAPTDAQEKA